MDDNSQSDSRLVHGISYPAINYLATLGLFLGGNLTYHRKVFRQNNNRLNFTGFLLINAFTSL